MTSIYALNMQLTSTRSRICHRSYQGDTYYPLINSTPKYSKVPLILARFNNRRSLYPTRCSPRRRETRPIPFTRSILHREDHGVRSPPRLDVGPHRRRPHHDRPRPGNDPERVMQAVCDLALRFAESVHDEDTMMTRFGVAFSIAGIDEQGPQL